MRARVATGALLVSGIVAIGTGCGGASPRGSTAPPQPKQAAAAPAAPACARVAPGVGAKPLSNRHESSTVALARADGGALLAYVADADEPTLHVVDVDAGRELAVVDLRGTPEQVLVLADGRVAVTLRQANAVEVLEPGASGGQLTSRCTVPVPTEPIAMAETADGSALTVTSGWAHTLSVLDGVTLTKRREVDVAREPRAVVIADDGRRAFVAHVVNATTSVVDLEEDKPEPRTLSMTTHKAPGIGNGSVGPKVRRGCQGYALAKAVDVDTKQPAPPPAVEAPPAVIAPPKPTKPAPVPQPRPVPPPQTVPGRVFAPFVTVDPGEAARVAYYGSTDGLPTEVSQVSVIDAPAERVLTRSVVRNAGEGRGECLLPRAAMAAGTNLYVTCLGIDALVRYDARAFDPARVETRRWSVPAGPTGLGLDAATGRAVVWSQFDRALSVIGLEQTTPATVITVSRKSGTGLTPEQALGRVLYHRSGDGRISTEGMACASCHPDGREDAITWGTTDGPRQTPMLAGRLADTAPYSWNGNHQSLEIHFHDTVRRLRGTGLGPSEEAALMAYVRTMPAPNVAPRSYSIEQAKRIEMGRALFHSAETACSSCHMPDQGWGDGAKHAISGGGAPGASALSLDTPSLRFVGGTAPYFHDGRYATLLEMLNATDHTMGYSAQLTREQRAALAAYMETL